MLSFFFVIGCLCKWGKLIAMFVSGIPFSSFYSCNVPHDDWGTRVKTLDVDLSQHIKTVSKQSRTITILVSDHGNAYSQFPRTHQQGRDESYHPVLYVIVPQRAQELLGIITSCSQSQPNISQILLRLLV